MFPALLTGRGCLAQEAGQWKAEALLLLCCSSWLALELAEAHGSQQKAVACKKMQLSWTQQGGGTPRKPEASFS